ncbi:MAG: lipoyl synthase [Acidobacteria bacterium]|nr:lipoyl synthase [Acidobacteriota bacterium]MBI3655326.1 lipoyl synthase [Acidobacteriota bacterium]
MSLVNITAPRRRHPEWLKVKLPSGENYTRLKGIMRSMSLHTVCEEARCPNTGDCWGRGIATFMILGEICTRGCRYCSVSKGKPAEVDVNEPERVAQAVNQMGLRHVVITSVDRDDLPDGGALIFAETIRKIRASSPDCRIEVLIPDFRGDAHALQTVMDAEPYILNHNTETVPRLYKTVRPGGKYAVSLELLRRAKAYNTKVITKTGLMVGLGEEAEEIITVMRDLVAQHVDIVTLGQYLQPSAGHLPVKRYYRPDEFTALQQVGEQLGLAHVEAGPLVRSSYHADEQVVRMTGAKPYPKAAIDQAGGLPISVSSLGGKESARDCQHRCTKDHRGST